MSKAKPTAPPAPPKPGQAAPLSERELFLRDLDSCLATGTATFAGCRTIGAILKSEGIKTVLTAGEAKSIADLQKRYDELGRVVSANPSDNGKAAFRAQRKAIAVDPGAIARLRTRESLAEESRLRRAASKEARRHLRAEANLVAVAAWERVARVCESFAAKTGEQERKRAADFGVSFRPSAELVAALSVSRGWTNLASALAGLPPQAQVSQLSTLAD